MRAGQSDVQGRANNSNFSGLVAVGSFCEWNDPISAGKLKIFKYYEVKLYARQDNNALHGLDDPESGAILISIQDDIQHASHSFFGRMARLVLPTWDGKY